MEIRQIPDYPNYGVTRDGRVWSYSINRFRKLYNSEWGTKVGLNVDGVKITKYVRRLVYCTFNNCEDVDCISHKDGDKYNNNLDNLVARTRHDHSVNTNTNRYLAKSLKHKKIVKIDVKTQKIEEVNLSRFKGDEYSREYRRIQSTVKPSYQGGRMTSNGSLYIIEGEKDKLIQKIQAQIKLNELLLETHDVYSVFRNSIRNNIKTNKKYLEILEGV